MKQPIQKKMMEEPSTNNIEETQAEKVALLKTQTQTLTK